MTSMPLNPELTAWRSRATSAAVARYTATTRYVVRRIAEMPLRGPAGPLRCRCYWPTRAHPGELPALVVFFHPGGFHSVSGESADTLCRAVCSRAGVVVLSGAYRPTPDNPYPAALQDAITTIEWATDHATDLGADPDRLLVAGEGFGGNLAAAAALHARDQQWPPLLRQILVDPSLDARQESTSYAEHPESPMISAAGLRSFYTAYLRGGHAPDDPYVSPLLAPSLAGVPPATVLTAEYDPLRDDGRRYAARLRDSGVEAEELRYHDLAHGTLALLGRIGVAERILTDLAQAIRRSARAPGAAGTTVQLT